jgi:Ran GTPase-activating protein (RanGAP) involved in mRNA processing and transport
MSLHALPEALLARLFQGGSLSLGLQTSAVVRRALLAQVCRLLLHVPEDGSLEPFHALLRRFRGPLETITLAAKRRLDFRGLRAFPCRALVTSLDLSAVEVRGADMSAFEHGLGALTHLRSLSMRSAMLGLRGVVALRNAVLRTKSLRALALSDGGLKHDGPNALAGLLRDCPLQVLDVSENNLSGEGLRHLMLGLRQGGTVSVLKMSGVHVGKETGLHIAEQGFLSVLPLETFLADGNDLHSDALAAILDTLPATVRALSLAMNKGFFNFGCGLCRFLRRPGVALETLSCAWNELADFGTQKLADGLRGCETRALRELDLRFNSAQDVGLLALMDVLAPFTGLHTLRLTGNKPSTFFWRRGASFAAVWRRLVFLDLGFMQMGCDGAVAFAAASYGAASLRTLLLGGNNLHERGMLAIADLLPSLSALRNLSVHSNPLDTAGIRALAHGLLACRAIEAVDASWCVVSDEGALALSALLPACETLRDLDLSWNSIGEPGARALRLAMAACRAPPCLVLAGNNRTGGEGGLLAAEFPDHVSLNSFCLHSRF